jgi:acyl-CoA oxidase
MNNTGSIDRKITASALLEERALCDFDRDELKNMLYGCPAELIYRNELCLAIEKHSEVLSTTPAYRELSKEEKQTALWKRVLFMKANYPHLVEKGKAYEWPYSSWNELVCGASSPVGLNDTMFALAVKMLADEEQKNHWMPLLQNHKILGCYAQTELGHGSNVG